MKPVVVGIIAAAAVIVAFIAGMNIDYNEGPIEEAAEQLDEEIQDMTDGSPGN